MTDFSHIYARLWWALVQLSILLGLQLKRIEAQVILSSQQKHHRDTNRKVQTHMIGYSLTVTK